MHDSDRERGLTYRSSDDEAVGHTTDWMISIQYSTSAVPRNRNPPSIIIHGIAYFINTHM